MGTFKSVAENATIIVLSRLSMLALPVLGAFALYVVQAKVDAVDAAITAQMNNVGALQNRMSVIETRAAAYVEERNRFYDQTDERLKAIEQSLTALAAGVASVNATLAADRDQRRSRQ